MVQFNLYSIIESKCNKTQNKSLEDIYQFIIKPEGKKVKNKKNKENQSFDSEIEHFKEVLKGDTIPAKSIIKIKPQLSIEWINNCHK